MLCTFWSSQGNTHLREEKDTSVVSKTLYWCSKMLFLSSWFFLWEFLHSTYDVKLNKDMNLNEKIVNKKEWKDSWLGYSYAFVVKIRIYDPHRFKVRG